MSLNKTLIDWVKNPDGTPGYTWNPITGCLNHVNGLCKGGGFPCYAYRLANTRLRERYLANQNRAWPFPEGSPDGTGLNDPFYPRFWPEKIQTMVRSNTSRRKPQGIFVCDMSDLFGIGVPEEWTARVLDVCKGNWRDRHYFLTKQSQNLVKFSPFPDNCWVGVTATNQEYISNALFHLAGVDANIKFLSIEPMLGKQNISFDVGEIQWLIIGAWTGSLRDFNDSNLALRRDLKLKRWGNKWTVQPKIEWVQEILVAAHNANIPVFMKENLQPLIDSSPGWGGWKLRQEMPK